MSVAPIARVFGRRQGVLGFEGPAVPVCLRMQSPEQVRARGYPLVARLNLRL
jgi:hypothetical protein